MLRTISTAAAMAVLLTSAAQAVNVGATIGGATVDFSAGFGNPGRFAFDNLSTDTDSLTMDEVPFQSVNGLTVGDVTFGYTGGDASYNADGPGTTSFVDDPSIEGDANGILSLDFATPTTVLSFGIALSAPSGAGIGAVVELVDGSGASLGVFDFLVTEDPGSNFNFVGGRFEATGTGVIPVPATLPLVLTGLAGMALAARRRPRARAARR